MDGADAVAGSVSGSTVTLDYYKLTGHTYTISTDIMLTDISGSEFGGVTTIYFTREVDKGSHPIINAYATLIGAYRELNNDAWGYHGSTHSSSSIQANFFTGTTSTSNPVTLRDIHAIIMFIAWGLLLPFGALWARYARHLPDALWFKVHRVTQYSGFTISLGGIILGYSMVYEQFLFLTHSIIGTLIMLFSAAQVVGAFFRPHKEENEPVTTARKVFEIFHHWNGRCLLVIAVVQIYLGISAIGYLEKQFWVIILWSIVVGLVVLVVLILEALKILNDSRDKDDHVEMK
jgi:hypothetical protein